MAKKALKKTAKVLGGLGAAYLASGYIRPGVQPEDVNAEDAAKDEMDRQDRIARTRVDKPAAPVVYNPRPSLYADAAAPAVEPPVKSRVVVPPDLQSDGFSKSMRELENRLDLREQANREPAILKKGGAVSASRRGDGVAQRGKTRGKMV
jgi:hypothetical protein